MRRAAPWLWLAGLLLAGAVHGAEPAGSKAAASPAASPPAFSWPPEVQKKMAEAEKKLTVVHRRALAAQMEKEIDAIVKTTGLNEAGRKALEAAVGPAMDQSLQKTPVALDPFLKPYRNRPRSSSC